MESMGILLYFQFQNVIYRFPEQITSHAVHLCSLQTSLCLEKYALL